MNIRTLTFLLLLFVIFNSQISEAQDSENEIKKKAVMVIHGGAGTILKENMTEAKENEIRQSIGKALLLGYRVIKKKGSSEDAIIEAIKVLEDDPNFNAGKGAVLNEEGRVELDASIMNGKNLEAGAVAGVKTVRNPIVAARAVKDNSKHVLLSGDGAEKFVAEEGLDLEDPNYFITEKQKSKWESARKKANSSGYYFQPEQDHKFGTVGAVALDKDGNISAGTSTGGMLMKKYGRVGDSPIIGGGTYADNESCGVSCTGHGEYFIRYAVAYDMTALMKYKELSVVEAANEIINIKLEKAGGKGGLICT